MPTTGAIILVSAIAIIVIVLLIWKNNQDKKLIDPDGPDSVEETHMDSQRRRDKL